MTLMIAPCIRFVTPPRMEKMVCEKMYDPAWQIRLLMLCLHCQSCIAETAFPEENLSFLRPMPLPQCCWCLHRAIYFSSLLGELKL